MKFIKSVDIEIDPVELAHAREPEELFEFIVKIDEYHANWDLTVMLYQHFSKEYDKYLLEQEELKEE